MPRILFLFLFLFTNYYLLITDANASGSLSVTPQIQTIDLKSDPATANLIYKNTTPVTIQLDFAVVDFKNVDEIGTPQFINPNPANNYKYGLSSWLTLSSNSIVLAAGEEKTLNVTIEKEKLSQGGHYAAVLAEIKQTNENKKISLKGKFASLIFVRADSKYNLEDAKIASIFANKSLLSFPDTYYLRFQNTGNIDTTPHGLIEIKDMFGRRVARGIINENSLISLPETIRKYSTPITSTTNLLLPGNYSVKISIHYGDSNRKIEMTSTFFYLGLPAVIIIIFITIILTSLLVKFKRLNKR